MYDKLDGQTFKNILRAFGLPTIDPDQTQMQNSGRTENGIKMDWVWRLNAQDSCHSPSTKWGSNRSYSSISTNEYSFCNYPL